MHQICVGLRHRILDARLPAGEHQLFQFTMGIEQDFGGRCLEGHAALGADDRISQVNAASDAEGTGQGFEFLDDGHR